MDISINEKDLIEFQTQQQLMGHLWSMGLDVSKPVYVNCDPLRRCNTYSGEARPDPIDRMVKTCIGFVPVTKPWAEIAA